MASSAAQAVDLVSEHMSFVTKISTVMKATSDDDKPMPGYLFKEINDISLEGPGTCESLLVFMVDRLEKPSCHVKLKVLKLMKYIVQNGNPNFAAGLRKMSQGIHLATKFSGPPDPLHGNVPYALVRQAAKDLSSVLFDVEGSSEAAVEKSQQQAAFRSRIVGLGASHTGSKMDGFGNSLAANPKSIGDSILDGLGKLAERWSETPEDRQRAVLSAVENMSRKGSYQPPVIPLPDPLSSSTHPPPPPKPVHIPGKAGGGWDDPDPSPQVAGRGHSDSHSTGSVGEWTDKGEVEGMEEWVVEEELVRKLVEESTGALLQPSQMSSFKAACSTCNCDHILLILARHLASESEPIVMKSMLLIETLMRSDLVTFTLLKSSCLQPLIELYDKWTGSPRHKAEKIIRIWERWGDGLGSFLPLPQQSSEALAQ